jgi:hypothetical protein
MRPPTRPRPAASIEAGRQALARGAWGEARACFEAALEGEATPEALEGLSWSAWWFDDARAVFGARESAYRLYREREDAAGAARMAIWLAVDHLDFHGASAVASGWLQRAYRLLDPLEPGPEHGWLTFLDGYVALIRGDAVKAEELGAYAAERRAALRDYLMWRCSASLWKARRSSPGRGWRRACTASTRRRRWRWKVRLRSRSRAPGRAASWSPRASQRATTSARSNGATGSPSSRSDTGAVTCSGSAGPSTVRCTSGAAGGRKPRHS